MIIKGINSQKWSASDQSLTPPWLRRRLLTKIGLTVIANDCDRFAGIDALPLLKSSVSAISLHYTVFLIKVDNTVPLEWAKTVHGKRWFVFRRG